MNLLAKIGLLSVGAVVLGFMISDMASPHGAKQIHEAQLCGIWGIKQGASAQMIRFNSDGTGSAMDSFMGNVKYCEFKWMLYGDDFQLAHITKTSGVITTLVPSVPHQALVVDCSVSGSTLHYAQFRLSLASR